MNEWRACMDFHLSVLINIIRYWQSCFRLHLVFMCMMLNHFSHVQLCVTPETAAHQAPQSLGFSRQGHWSGLSFPSPVHESRKWKWSRSVVSDSSWPHGLQPTMLLCPWDFPGKSTGVGCHCLLRFMCIVTVKLNTNFRIKYDWLSSSSLLQEGTTTYS